jgi:hypothetical protein
MAWVLRLSMAEHTLMAPVALLEHALDEERTIPARAAFSDFDMAATGPRFRLDKERGRALTHVVMLGDGDLSAPGRDGCPDRADQFLARLIPANPREASPLRQPANIQGKLLRRAKGGVRPEWQQEPIYVKCYPARGPRSESRRHWETIFCHSR